MSTTLLVPLVLIGTGAVTVLMILMALGIWAAYQLMHEDPPKKYLVVKEDRPTLCRLTEDGPIRDSSTLRAFGD